MTDHTPQPISSPLDGRRVLVTGASSGIGRAAAIALGAAGARVALAARSTDVLHEVAAEVGDDERVLIAPLDVTDMSQCSAAAAAIGEAWGGLDAVINSAGLALTGGLLEMQPADWATMFDVNVNGLLNITAAVAPMLQASELADIVNISSMSGRRRASVSLGIYAATKHAVHVLSDNLREEFAGEIRVTTMSPGFVDTPIFEGATTEAGEQYRASVREKGLDADVVAGHIVHALAQPAGVNLFEIALLSTSQ